jgi:RNA polymerase sigma-70 factor (ECF subfamily)
MRSTEASAALDVLARTAQERLARGERGRACEAYEVLVGRLQRRASRLAYWYLRSVEDADDAVQEAFVKAFERLDQFRPGRPFEAWFLRILVNGCLDRSKSRGRRQKWMLGAEHASGVEDRMAAPEPTPEARLLFAERQRALAQAIQQLPDRQRTVVLLSQLDGRSSAEIGELTGLRESTVRVHLFRAMRRLRELLAAPADRPRARHAGGR